MLQDALEIIFLAMLSEKNVDEQKALESKTFDEFIGELRKAGVNVPKLGRGGHKAPYWMRNREWIEKNVRDPIDYVQIDHERLRLDGMEWGVNTAELENLRRLTPEVFRSEKGSPWHIKYDMAFPANEATLANARYCLDRAISILLRKQQHTRAKRWPRREMPFDPPTIYIDAPVYERASQGSNIVHRIQSDYDYTIDKTVTGFNPDERFYYISGSRPDPKNRFGSGWVYGYLLIRQEEPDEPLR